MTLYPKNIEVAYYWYYHMIPNELRNEIQEAIDNHDFKAFKFYYDTLNTADMCFLPKEASIYCGDKHIGEIGILNEGAFSMITFSESECG